MTEADEKPRILETVEEVAPPAASSPSPARKTKKRRPLRWSSFSYTTRVTLAFALIAAMTALVAIGVVSFVWEQHFRTYTADNMKTLCETTANRIAVLYKNVQDAAGEDSDVDPLRNEEVTKPAAQAAEITSGVGVKVVDDLDGACAHIAAHSTGHSEAIVTRDEGAAQRFIRAVDSAAVYWNASTRFTDGGEFGLGCEMGISTQRLHARGPMGLAELCSYKYVVRGTGQVR